MLLNVCDLLVQAFNFFENLCPVLSVCTAQLAFLGTLKRDRVDWHQYQR